jgi:uncharacterized protein YjlB
MPIKDQVKNYARKLVEDRPSPAQARQMARNRKALLHRFSDDGIVPNHQHWPVIIYRNAVRFSSDFEPAAVVDSLFEANGWGRSWRDSIYDFVHYHSQIHEVLGVARGHAVVEFGGVKGRHLYVKAGDIAIVPAGTGHRLIEASRTFLVVGAYPKTGTYDECTDTRDRQEAIKRIRKVKRPTSDPVYGRVGGLIKFWR